MGKKKRVLIVDDDRTTLGQSKGVVENLGYEVLEAGSGMQPLIIDA
jgi:CheY-like chemotaxis protein